VIELTIRFISGERKGESLTLQNNELSSHSISTSMPYILEDEAITLELNLPKTMNNINLSVYDIKIPYTEAALLSDGFTVQYKWVPTFNYGKHQPLFSNFFGTTEISVEVEENNASRVITFPEFEVLATKMSATRVEDMLTYIASLSDKYLLAAFHVTKKSGGLEKGSSKPELAIEKIEKITSYIELLTPLICHAPITKLNSAYEVRQFNQHDSLDDHTISWLCNNLSVLEPTDSMDEAILRHDGQYYRAPQVEMPVLKEDTDIYENRVIHGFIENLIADVESIYNTYEEYKNIKSSKSLYTGGKYKSFFNVISKFTHYLAQPKQRRCIDLTERLMRVKFHLNHLLPVSRSIRDTPHVTPKVRVNKPYLDVYYQIILWQDHVKPNWMLYDNLMGIKSIPILFEYYTYCRIAETLNTLFKNSDDDNSTFIFDVNDSKIKLLKEPNFWMVDHINSQSEQFVNTEGWTEYYNKKDKVGELRVRSSKGPNARRAPDVVI
jgi:hypothetical protein